MVGELVTHYCFLLEKEGLKEALNKYDFKETTKVLFKKVSPERSAIFWGFLPGALGFLALEYSKEILD